MSGKSKKKVLLKLIVVGNSNVGKTALLGRFVRQKFIEDHKATIGADFMTKEITIDDKLVTMQIWDTAGQERFQSLGTAFYRGSDACALVYDVTDEQSFKDIDKWRSAFLDQASPEDAGNFPFLLLGNKTDLAAKRAVQTTDGKVYADRHRMVFYETSAKDNVNVDDAFRQIAAVGSERDTVPIFSPDVAERIIKFEKEGVTEPPAAGCACTLI
jgi:Ras-related protein Rab-7A